MASSGATRLFFATDLHGSTRCFRKFLNAAAHYGADVSIMGGDLSGKRFVPIVQEHDGSLRSYYSGQHHAFRDRKEALGFAAGLEDQGVYGFFVESEEWQGLQGNEEELRRLELRLLTERLEQWIELAEERLGTDGPPVFFNTGNDDPFALDPILDESAALMRPEGKVLELPGDLYMASTGFANQTPFQCPRDVPEAALRERINTMVASVTDMGRMIFNFHCPPRNTVLDRAVEIDEELRPLLTGFGAGTMAAGSEAVREAIEEYQPLLGLHGHIHESRGSVRLGRTLCLNPGSEYESGILRGALVEIGRSEIRSFSLVAG